MQILEQISFACVSVLGSIIAYFALIIYPPSKDGGDGDDRFSERMNRWKQVVNADKRLLFFDIFFSCVIVGVVYTIIILEVVTCKQALFGGLTAEACMYNYIHNARKCN